MHAAPKFLSPGIYHAQKADVWALAMTLYAMETDKSPFSGENDRRVVAQITKRQLMFLKDDNGQSG
jgi:serine/threonine protein kinase